MSPCTQSYDMYGETYAMLNVGGFESWGQSFRFFTTFISSEKCWVLKITRHHYPILVVLLPPKNSYCIVHSLEIPITINQSWHFLSLGKVISMVIHPPTYPPTLGGTSRDGLFRATRCRSLSCCHCKNDNYFGYDCI